MTCRTQGAIGVWGTAARTTVGAALLLLAAAHGYAGSALLAVWNWLLRRAGQVGCALLGTVDLGAARGTANRAARTSGVGHGH